MPSPVTVRVERPVSDTRLGRSVVLKGPVLTKRHNIPDVLPGTRLLDGILVSDVGKRFEVRGNRPAGGLIRTALRSTDIVMDRVWQHETRRSRTRPASSSPRLPRWSSRPKTPRRCIRRSSGRWSTSAPTSIAFRLWKSAAWCVTDTVSVARYAGRTPTSLELSCRSALPGIRVPGPRTDPPAAVALPGRGPLAEPVAATAEARALQDSALRRIWSTLLTAGTGFPTSTCHFWCHSSSCCPTCWSSPASGHAVNHLVDSLSQGSRELGQMSRLLEGRQEAWIGEPAEEVRGFDESDFKGFGFSRTRASLTCVAGSQASLRRAIPVPWSLVIGG